MSTWYYAEDGWRRRGPFPAEDLVALYRAGQLHTGTLVWRVGLNQWQPLAVVAAELGLHAPLDAMPPPLPGPRPPVPWRGATIAALLIAAAGGLLLTTALIGALALPLHHARQPRAKIAAAVATMAAQQPAITSFAAARGRCPENGDNGFGAPGSYADGPLGELRFGRFDNRHCGMEGLLSVPGVPLLDGKAIWIDYDADSDRWRCSSEIDDRHLPPPCRG